MHIVHIYKDYYPVLGGIENHLRVLAEGLAARGHRVTVLVSNTGSRDVITRMGDLTVIKAGRMSQLASTPLSPRMLLHARRLTDVDLVHLHVPYPPGDLAALAIPGRPPLAVYYHSDVVRQKTLLRFYRPLLEHTLDRATRIIASSPAYITSSPWLRLRADRCVIAPLSVDPRRFANPDPAAVTNLRARYDSPLLLFVGRLRYYKGLHILLNALPHIRNAARLLIVGVGSEEPNLRAQVAATPGLKERVHFLGEVSDTELATIYAAANIFVLPSHLRSEAFGIVQLEAQAAGLPVVCSELGTGTSYINRHGETGFVVPPADPTALARAIDVLLANPDLARKMGAAGQARATSAFDHRTMITRMEEIYRKMIAS